MGKVISMNLMIFHDFLMKMENALLLRPRRAGSPQTIVIISKINGPGGVQSARESQKSSKIAISHHFRIFHPESLNLVKFGKFHQIWSFSPFSRFGPPKHSIFLRLEQHFQPWAPKGRLFTFLPNLATFLIFT